MSTDVDSHEATQTAVAIDRSEVQLAGQGSGDGEQVPQPLGWAEP